MSGMESAFLVLVLAGFAAFIVAVVYAQARAGKRD